MKMEATVLFGVQGSGSGIVYGMWCVKQDEYPNSGEQNGKAWNIRRKVGYRGAYWEAYHNCCDPDSLQRLVPQYLL